MSNLGRIARCPHCGGVCSTRVQASDVNRGISDEIFDLQACEDCGLMHVSNPPADLGRYYAADYYSIPASLEALDSNLPGQAERVRILERFKTGGALLEIGPAIGLFSRAVQLRGFDVSAIEYDADCVRFLRDQVGVRAVHSSAPAATIRAEGRHYDAICLWHVIEHLPEPWVVLDAIADHLKPGGVVVIAAPNPQAWQARVLGRHWPHYDLPRHLFQLPMPWLSAHAKRRGLSVALATTRDADSLYWNRFTWAMLLRRATRSRPLGGRIWQAGLAFGALLQPWEGMEGRGAAYTMVLKRDG